MNNQQTIGKIIERDLRKKGINLSQFAKKIDISRGSLYNRFASNSMDINLLRLISKELNHNYFQDLAIDLDLAQPTPIDAEEYYRLKKLGTFLEAVPRAFEDMGYDVQLVISTKIGIEKEIPLPDYILTDFNLTFTIDQTYEEKCNGCWGNGMLFEQISETAPGKMVLVTNQFDGMQTIDIAIDDKTPEQWNEVIRFVINEIPYLYMPRTLEYLQEMRKKRLISDID